MCSMNSFTASYYIIYGCNSQSIVVMDNTSIHSVEGIVEMIQQVGAIVIFLPPYSPDYNPIEELFSKVKKLLNSMNTACTTLKWIYKLSCS